MTLFPEGCTTNGECMVKYKKGAFASLKAVRPVVLTYHYYFGKQKIYHYQDVIAFYK